MTLMLPHVRTTVSVLGLMEAGCAGVLITYLAYFSAALDDRRTGLRARCCAPESTGSGPDRHIYAIHRFRVSG